VIGVSVDNAPDDVFWKVLEFIFFTIYLSEFIIKCTWLGIRYHFTGPDMSWNIFDFLCLVISAVELLITYTSPTQNKSEDTGVSWTLLKILRLCRLVRLLRLMRFKVFKELKLMFMGLISGLRALGWALVLLMGIIYMMSIVLRSYFGTVVNEFATVNSSMFTLFRCLTDTCETLHGDLIPELLFHRYGEGFSIPYILFTMLIGIGLFNLIMAVFIDNVTKSQDQRKQKELGETAASVECQLKIMLAKFIKEPRAGEDDSRGMVRRLSDDALKRLRSLTEIGFFRNLSEQKLVADASFTILEDAHIVITRQVFQAWLRDPEFVRMLEEADVDISNKFELFNILDVDHGGELSANELLTGLMSLRGDVSKGDVVSTLLRVRDLGARVEALHQKLDEKRNSKSDERSGSRSSEI
jgi:hypothetical protein